MQHTISAALAPPHETLLTDAFPVNIGGNICVSGTSEFIVQLLLFVGHIPDSAVAVGAEPVKPQQPFGDDCGWLEQFPVKRV